jgi:hypothetical protein
MVPTGQVVRHACPPRLSAKLTPGGIPVRTSKRLRRGPWAPGHGNRSRFFAILRPLEPMMSADDVDDLLDDGESELEARFRELEQEAEIARMRSRSARPVGADARAVETAPSEGSPVAGAVGAQGDDPLADLKSALDGDREAERYLLVLCIHCGAKNRMSLTRARRLTPLCGGCKKELAFIKS